MTEIPESRCPDPAIGRPGLESATDVDVHSSARTTITSLSCLTDGNIWPGHHQARPQEMRRSCPCDHQHLTSRAWPGLDEWALRPSARWVCQPFPARR
jgi:hypothetical protein